MTTEELMPLVQKGAAWLDEQKPGWVSVIDTARLDLSNCKACALGQCFGNYYETVAHHRGTGSFGRDEDGNNAWASARGFDRPFSIVYDEVARHAYFKTLTECWITVILARRFIAKHSVGMGVTPAAVDPVEGAQRPIEAPQVVHARI